MTDQQQWYAGVDWASQNHHVLLLDAGGRKISERIFKHGGEGLAAMSAWLIATSGAESSSQIQVAIEVPHGPIVETLLEQGFRVFSLNPKQMDRFRDRFTIAGAKDDSRDAEVMAACLRTDLHCYRSIEATNPVIVELREWSRMTDDLITDQNRLTNRMRDQLWRYFPAMLDLATELHAEWFLDLWDAVPTPEKAMRVREKTIAMLLKRTRIRRFGAGDILRILRQPRLQVAAGTTEAATAHLRTLIERVRLVNRQLAQARCEIDMLTTRLIPADDSGLTEPMVNDVEILASLPGVGRVVLATLLAEGYDVLQRRDYAALRSLTGVAPVTKRSGKSCIIIRRQACNTRLANVMYHWARTAIQNDLTSRSKYSALRARGHSHGRALRSVGDRLLNVACAMLRGRTIFEPKAVARPQNSA